MLSEYKNDYKITIQLNKAIYFVNEILPGEGDHSHVKVTGVITVVPFRGYNSWFGTTKGAVTRGNFFLQLVTQR